MKEKETRKESEIERRKKQKEGKTREKKEKSGDKIHKCKRESV